MNKSKILVIEDDPAITNLIRTTLDTQDYQYHTARTGSAGLMDAVAFRSGASGYGWSGNYSEDPWMEHGADYCSKCTKRRQ